MMASTTTAAHNQIYHSYTATAATGPFTTTFTSCADIAVSCCVSRHRYRCLLLCQPPTVTIRATPKDLLATTRNAASTL